MEHLLLYRVTHRLGILKPIVTLVEEIFDVIFDIINCSFTITQGGNFVVLGDGVLCLFLEPAPKSRDTIGKLHYVQSLWKNSTVGLTAYSISC